MATFLTFAAAASGASCVFGLPSPALAQDAGQVGASVSTFVFVGALTVLPFVFMTTTSFLKISVVFSILKSALGAGDVPSGMVVTALAVILSAYVMAPVGEQMLAAASPNAARVDLREPLADPGSLAETITAGAEPLRAFLERNAGARERAVFLDLARRARPRDARASIGASDFRVVLPAFVVTELSEAFQIGVLVFVPFLVIDLMIANLLLSLGMTQLLPHQVALPFKLLLFVLVDGWYLLARALVLGYA